MLNKVARRRVHLTVAAALLVASQPGASRPAPQGNPPPGRNRQAASQAGAKPDQQPNPAAPALRKITRLVQVSVVAHDKHGNPIPDLTQDDFHVFDGGVEQTIALFSRESARVLPADLPVLPPNTWSNHSTSRSGVPVNLTVILFDALNTQLPDQSYARQEIIRFLSQIRPEDRVALYALGSNLRVLHEFTSDAASLLRALSRHAGYNGPLVPPQPRPSPAIPPPQDPDAPNANEPLSSFLEGRDAVQEQFQLEDRVRRTIDALEAIAAHVGTLPGRKSLLWVSAAFPISFIRATNVPDVPSTPVDSRFFIEELKRVSRALNDANIAVYPVDARGLTIDMTALTDSSALSRRPRYAAPQGLAPDSGVLFTMQDIAARTGGIAFHDTNDIKGAIRTAIDDSRVVYTLAYMPTHNEWNGEFRKIKVEMRRPDVRLRFRSGYFALPDSPLSPAQQQHLLAEAQWSPLEASEITLTVQAERTTANGKPQIRFVLVADPPRLHFTEAEGRHTASLMLALAQRTEDGRVVWEESKDLGFQLKDDKYQAVIAGGLRLAGTKALDPAATQFRFVLLDTATGHLGSLDVPLAKLTVAAGTPPAAAPLAPAISAPTPPTAQKPDR